MGIYHQIGHDSQNLIFENKLDKFNGAIMSPLNYDFDKTTEIVNKVSELNRSFEIIFDPQLFIPTDCRDNLRKWKYFPEELETADLSAITFWAYVNNRLLDCVINLGISSVCTPIHVPRHYSDKYYSSILDIGDHMRSQNPGNLKIYQSVIVNLPLLVDLDYVYSIASILTNRNISDLYLIINTDIEPRRELKSEEELIGVMSLIYLLQKNNINVLLGYCSSDMLLYKYAGVKHVATGKFFNLRRFTLTRWENSDGGGGGQLPYLFEKSLLGFFRQSDIPRLQNINLLSTETINNPYFSQIMESISTGENWLGISWRFYLYSMQELELELSENQGHVHSVISEADRNWGKLEEARVILEERLNDGSWLRTWLRCVSEVVFE